MIIKAAISTASDSVGAAAELGQAVRGFMPDLAALWVSPHHGPDYAVIVDRIQELVSPRNFIGCSGESIIGPGREIEQAPAAALWVAKMPGVRVLPFVVDQNDLTTLDTDGQWHDRLGVKPEDVPTFIVLPDPFSIQFDACLRSIDGAFPGCAIVGGVASAAKAPGENRLFLNDQILRQGLVGVSLTGDLRVSTIVSQGCRPVGDTYVITRAEENVIYQLGGRDAYAVLKQVHDDADSTDRALIRQGVHIGRVIDERLQTFGPGDYLIRNVAGIVENRGLAVTDNFRAGQTIRFHVRDALSADAEMRTLLESRLSKMHLPPRGGFLFNCNGRGTRLFPDRNHDIGLINQAIPECPIAGFFAAGEIGPVGGRTFVHGFTSSLILFHEP